MKRVGIIFLGFCFISMMAGGPVLAQDKTKVEFCGYSVGSPQYIWTAAHANLVNKYSKAVMATPAFCGAETAVVKMLGQGKTQFGEVCALELEFAKQGLWGFKKDPKQGKEFYEKIRAVYFQPYGTIEMVTLAESGIKSFKDFKGKKISFGSAAHTGHPIMKYALEAEGLTEGKDYTAVYLSCGSGHGPDAVADRTCAACYCISPGGMPSVMNLSTLNKIRIVGFSSSDVQKKFFAMMDEKFGQNHALRPSVSPPGIYGKNQVNTEPTLSVAYDLIWATRADLDANVVYEVTKALFDHLDEFYQTAGDPSRNVTLKDAVKNIPLPIHPGAEKYFREKGVLK